MIGGRRCKAQGEQSIDSTSTKCVSGRGAEPRAQGGDEMLPQTAVTRLAAPRKRGGRRHLKCGGRGVAAESGTTAPQVRRTSGPKAC